MERFLIGLFQDLTLKRGMIYWIDSIEGMIYGIHGDRWGGWVKGFTVIRDFTVIGEVDDL